MAAPRREKHGQQRQPTTGMKGIDSHRDESEDNDDGSSEASEDDEDAQSESEDADSDTEQRRPRVADDLDRPGLGIRTDSDGTSAYSTVSEDSLPPIQEYGHTYHGSGRLLFPSDETETGLWKHIHDLNKLCLHGELTAARLPLGKIADEQSKATREGDDPSRTTFDILDIGAGNGQWATEMAQRYTQAQVLGIDLSSALLPSDVPPNVTFEVFDAEEHPWPASLSSRQSGAAAGAGASSRGYDFIHMRALAGGGVRDWEALWTEAFTRLKPGGQLEFAEWRQMFYDMDSAEGGEGDVSIPPASNEWITAFGTCCAKLGVDFDPLPRAAAHLRSLGAEVVREQVDWLPVVSRTASDPLMRQKGELVSKILESGIENWSLRLFGMGGWNEEDTRALVRRVHEEMRDPNVKMVLKIIFVTAKKPVRRTEQ